MTFAQELAAFVATRQAGIDPALSPSDAPATEEYTYNWAGMTWCIRCEAGRYVFDWRHPAYQDRPTLAEAEAALFATIQADQI
jgi:hypothetical protein